MGERKSGAFHGGGGGGPRQGSDANGGRRNGQSGNGHTYTDQEIRIQIEERFARERAPRASRLIVSVGTGVVTLRGEVDDELEHTRLVDLVREVTAVRELRDELITRGGAN